MSQLSAAQISKLCDDWCAASTTPNGGMVGSKDTDRFRLLANGVVFHELDHEALCAALLGLTKVLLRPRLSMVVHQEHFVVWSWCGELLLSPRAELFPREQDEIKSLYETALHAALVECRKPSASREERQAQNQINDLQSHHAKQLLRESVLVLAYLAFPLLEAVLKRACKNFVSFDGQVVSPFTVQNRHGNPRNYDPQGARNRQCSSLRDLLFLHYTHVAEPELKTLLDQFRSHLATLDGTQDPFDLVFGWRNQSLHGSSYFHPIGGGMLSLSLLISLFELRQNFDKHRAKILEHCRWEAQRQHRSPWSFYPPY